MCEIIDGRKLCSKCKELLPICEFNPNPKLKSGLHSHCNDCRKSIGRNRYNKKLVPIEIIDGHKQCTKCERLLPINRFSKGDKFKDGFNRQCKDCCNQYEKKLITIKVVDGHKHCSNCKELLPIDNFNKNPSIKSGLHSHCKVCRVEVYNKFLLKRSNKLKIEKDNRRKEIMSNYNVDTWDEVRKIKSRERNNERYWEDSLFKFKRLMRNNVRNSFKRKGFGKNTKSREILGADWDVIRKYFEGKFVDGMNWENYGKWHIDHILPISTAVSEEDIIRLNHYTNLQPLWAEDNLKKSDKLTIESHIKKHFPYYEVTVDVSNKVTNTEIKINDEYKFGWGVF